MRYFVTILVIIIVALGAIGLWQGWFTSETSVDTGETATSTENGEQTTNGDEDEDTGNGETEPSEVIGTSAGGRDITAHHYGNGEKEVLFVGGIHGGYSANTTLLARSVMDELSSNPDMIPSNVTVTVIPVLNPDGLNEVLGTTEQFTAADIPSSSRTQGRFNANGVDLNRNFDCKWQSTGRWQSRNVDGGSAAFSEPEAQAIRDYVRDNRPAAVVAYYSAAGGVYSSSCQSGVMSEAQELMKTYADATGYAAEGTFDAYEVTGDMTDWLAKIDVPAISVLLDTHTRTEWSKNRAGVEAVINSVSSQ